MRALERLYRWLFSSLANQLLITYLLVIMIALVVVSLWAYLTIKRESITDLRNSLEVEAVNLALEIDNDLQLESSASRERVQKAVERRATKLGVSITTVDRNGHVLADSGPIIDASTKRPEESSKGENLLNESEIADALAGIIATSRRSSPATNTNWLYVAYPVRSAGVTSGVIRVGVPLTEVEQRLEKDLIFFLEIILATGVVTVLISLWLAERVNRPVKEMSRMAKEISISGDISSYLPVRRTDEIGELSLAFNQMIGRLQEQERMRQEFISNASHELKTPAMAIGSVVEALLAGAGEDPALRRKFLASLEKLVDRQDSLIRDLLDISKLDSNDAMEWSDDVNIVQVISEAVEQVRPQSQKKNQILSIPEDLESGERSTLRVRGSMLQLQRAFINLLTNAINYTPEGGSVAVMLRQSDGGRIQIRIRDTGAGISPEDIPHIFERFYRGDKSRAREAGGSGLGLAITREIVARHHGTLEVDSVVGQGSTFTMVLPSEKARSTES
ncbi:MAG: cell wall metabolism sensor histidine kinase WalK [Candidatus Obscuribacterales bacterium]|nr:cell wall metabolism sensor histidine kinase WalK [Candidatus Obscuribacterales bacterium]